MWCEPKCRVEQGPEAEKIMEVAFAHGADLIVLGVRTPQGMPGAATHVSHSVAHEIVADAPCPVLTFRA
jgi:nucleotide-binding universal stress UspA family protein